jgi:integrase
MTKRFALTDKQITTAKPGSASQLTDGMGLYLKLFFDRASGHSWRFDYKSPVTGRRNTLVFGSYPTVSLKLARDKAQEARELIARGVDPAGQRNEAKAAQEAATVALVVADERKAKGFAAAGTLLGVAEDMHEGRLAGGAWSAAHARQWLGMIKRCVPASVALLPIGDVKPDHILREVIRPLEAAGKDATAITVRRFLSDLFDYAERMEIRQGNPARAIRKDAKKAEHSDNIGNNPGATDPATLATVLRRIRDWGNPVTRAALQVQAALFQRPANTCGMRWADLDLDAGTWVIQAPRRSKLHKSLKGGAHIVPLPAQVVAVLRSLKPLTGHQEWVFLSTAGTGKPITNDTLTNALRTMGLGNIQTAHGFRATARTMAPTHCGVQPQFVEAQLAHAIGMQTIDGRMVRDTNGTAYNRAVFTDERRAMLQVWADYLDSLLAEPQTKALPAASVAVVAEPELLAA